MQTRRFDVGDGRKAVVVVVVGMIAAASIVSRSSGAQDVPALDTQIGETSSNDAGAVRSRVGSAASSTSDTLCAPFWQRTWDVLRAAPEADTTDAPWGRCYSGPWGAWGIVLDSLVPTDPESGDGVNGRGRWGIAYVTAAGARSMVIPSSPEPRNSGAPVRTDINFEDGMEHHFHLHVYPTIDFDHDGTPEIFLKITISGDEWGEANYGQLWTVRGGVPSAYPPTTSLNIDSLDDRDHDGRPEVTFEFPPGGINDNSGMLAQSVSGVSLAGHSLDDGTFSFTDSVAASAARLACPTRPSPLVARTGRRGAVDQVFTAKNVICARIWGASPEDILAELNRDRGCTNIPPGPRRSGVENCPEARRMARLIPPVDPARVAEVSATPVPGPIMDPVVERDVRAVAAEVNRLSTMPHAARASGLGAFATFATSSPRGNVLRDVCLEGLRSTLAHDDTAGEISRVLAGTEGTERPVRRLTLLEFSRLSALRVRLEAEGSGFDACRNLLREIPVEPPSRRRSPH